MLSCATGTLCLRNQGSVGKGKFRNIKDFNQKATSNGFNSLAS